MRKNYSLLIVTIVLTFILSSLTIDNYDNLGVTNLLYAQIDPAKTNITINTSATTNSMVNLLDIPPKKVHVGDIDITYKMFGKDDPLILFNGASDGMDAWDPGFLAIVSSNQTAIAFDQRGIGNTTAGTQSYTHEQLANDTAGLMDALRIQKADVWRYSLGSYLAQQLTVGHADKVNSLILVGSSCSGKDHTPKPAEFVKLQSEIVNKS